MTYKVEQKSNWESPYGKKGSTTQYSFEFTSYVDAFDKFSQMARNFYKYNFSYEREVVFYSVEDNAESVLMTVKG